MTCTIPSHLSSLSSWSLTEWLRGNLTDTGFIFYFTRSDSRLLDLADCLCLSITIPF